jgi:transcription antitermination factor NusG
LQEGQRVRIVDGPLKGVEGVLVQSKPNKGLLVISVELLRRSVAVEVDGTQVAPSVTVNKSCQFPTHLHESQFATPVM